MKSKAPILKDIPSTLFTEFKLGSRKPIRGSLTPELPAPTFFGCPARMKFLI